MEPQNSKKQTPSWQRVVDDLKIKGSVFKKTKFWLRICIYMSIGFFAATSDIFGITTATDVHSEILFQRFFAPFHNTSKQNASTVVLVDDESLDKMNLTWPLTYKAQARILGDILALKPRAVFVDIIFPKVRKSDPTAEVLIKTLKSRAGEVLINKDGVYAQRIPVFLASGKVGDYKTFDRLKEVTIPAAIGWDGGVNAYPLYLGKNAPNAPQRTAAYALFHMLCAGKAPSDLCPSDMGQALAENEAFGDPMNIQWGSAVPKGQGNFSELSSCRDISPGNLVNSVIDAVSFMVEGISGGINNSIQKCPYTLTLRLQQMTNRRALKLPQYREAIEGRVIFYGMKLTGIPDHFWSPAHGQVPGVYLHAMAFDNLLLNGTNYSRYPTWEIWGIGPDQIAEVLVWMILVFWISGNKTTREIMASSRAGTAGVISQKRVRVYFFVISLVLTISTSVIMVQLNYVAMTALRR